MVKSVKIKNNSFKLGVATVLIIVVLAWILSKEASNKSSPSNNGGGVTACSLERQSVCGEDGKTYTNSCIAEKTYNIRIAHEGACTIAGGS